MSLSTSLTKALNLDAFAAVLLERLIKAEITLDTLSSKTGIRVNRLEDLTKGRLHVKVTLFDLLTICNTVKWNVDDAVRLLIPRSTK